MNNQIFKTPTAPVLWANLYEASVYEYGNPNAKPNPEAGEYGAWQFELVLNPAIAEHKEFLEMLDGECEEAVASRSDLNGTKKPVLYSRREELDSETKSPTGAFRVKFKMKAGGISRKTNKHWQKQVAYFDAASRLMELEGEVANGSIARCAFEIRPYATGGVIGCSLYLRSVQFLQIDYKASGGAGAAETDFAGDVLTDALGSSGNGSDF